MIAPGSHVDVPEAEYEEPNASGKGKSIYDIPDDDAPEDDADNFVMPPDSSDDEGNGKFQTVDYSKAAANHDPDGAFEAAEAAMEE